MSILDVNTLIPNDNPKEWDDVPKDIQDFLEQKRNGIYNPVQRKVHDRILKSRWFLVKNELRVNSRYGKTTFLTLGGIELPFNGLSDLILVLQSYDKDTRERLFSAMRPGTIEPITKERAYKNISNIRAKGFLIYPNVDISSVV